MGKSAGVVIVWVRNPSSQVARPRGRPAGSPRPSMTCSSRPSRVLTSGEAASMARVRSRSGARSADRGGSAPVSTVNSVAAKEKRSLSGVGSPSAEVSSSGAR